MVSKMASASEELKESKERLVTQFSCGEVSADFQERYSEIMDEYFRKALQESKAGHRLFSKKTPFAFIAVGGYGRKELCFHSDIDIIILFGSKIPPQAKELSDEIFFPLWDLGLDLGYGIRNIKDCITLSREDFEVLTSIMDARFLCGDSQLYFSLMEAFHKKVIIKQTTAFGRWLEERDKIRIETFGDASYLLEPNLKDGIGGLRDYHHVLWLARVLLHSKIPRDLEYLGKLSHNEYQELRGHLEFIWLVRNYLHFFSGRKNDRLGFEYQEKIAKTLGFKDQKNMMAVENFLGKLHVCMASIKTIYRYFILTNIPGKQPSRNNFRPEELSSGLCLYQEKINFNSATAILSDPFLLVEIFEKSSSLGFPLSIEALRLVREFLVLVDDSFRSSGRAVSGFLNVLKGENAVSALDQMFESGFLETFIPEFGQIKDRVQFDAYHIFPVGRHSLETFRYLKNLKDYNDLLLLDIYSDLTDPEPLLLAALFHDLGKVGGNHAKKGVSITRNILKRFGYDKNRTVAILSLVKNHLVLMKTATRRDLNDEKVVVLCARSIGNLELLTMLYLLTWADAKATGPGAWTEWTANLVQELFFKSIHILERKELATPRASKIVKKTKSELRRAMADRMDLHELEDYFEVMSPRYMLNITTHDIIGHLVMVDRLKEDINKNKEFAFVFEVEQKETEGCWDVTVSAKDRPGLFSDIAGVLALNNINILSAHIYTWRNNIALDIFKVTNPLDPIRPNKTWKKVEADLKATFAGKLSLDYRLGKKAATSIISSAKKPSRPPEVRINNESSDFFTLIEVIADDNVGLLFLITRALFDLRLNIRIAKIAIQGDQAADIFYVRDLEGRKVEEKEQILELRSALLHKLNRGF